MEELTTADSIPAAETSLVHRLSQLAGEGLSAGLAQGTESDDEIDVDVYEKVLAVLCTSRPIWFDHSRLIGRAPAMLGANQ